MAVTLRQTRKTGSLSLETSLRQHMCRLPLKKKHLHIGKSPKATFKAPSLGDLSTLNTALQDALQKENYEEAAKLRDDERKLLEKLEQEKIKWAESQKTKGLQ